MKRLVMNDFPLKQRRKHDLWLFAYLRTRVSSRSLTETAPAATDLSTARARDGRGNRRLELQPVARFLAARLRRRGWSTVRLRLESTDMAVG